MNIIVYIVLSLLLLILISLGFVLFSRAVIKLSLDKKNAEQPKLSIEASILKYKVTKELDFSKKEEKNVKKEAEADVKKAKSDLAFLDKLKMWYGVFCDFVKTYRLHRYRIKKAVYAEKIELSVGFGTSDAAETGIITGALWTGVYNVLAFVSKIISITEPKISITPDFSNERCEFKLNCIIKARVVHLIGIGLMAGFSFYRFQKKRSLPTASLSERAFKHPGKR